MPHPITPTTPSTLTPPASEMPLLGYILSASLPKMRVPVAALHELATTTGYPTSYLPEARSVKPAFERATTEATGGAQGMVVTCPEEVAEEIKARFGTRPTLRLRLATIQRGQGKEICPTRHLVGEIIVPPAGDVAEQRRETTVARFTLKGGVIQVEQFPIRAFPRAVLAPVIGQVQADFAAFCAEIVDENALRAGLRDYLADLFGLMGNPRLGVYFIPVTAPDALEKLCGIQAFIQGLQTYVANGSSLTATW
ncbi:MAG: hypothetical protein H0T73_23020 [Ardenticatenales bacterium]|nr:hypothetical protein [Ardenticatenales bacterium]